MAAADIHTPPSSNTPLLLDKLVVGLVAFILALRGMGGGLTPEEPEGALLGVLIALACVLRLARLCMGGCLSLPRHGVWLGVILFAGMVTLSWRTGVMHGVGRISSDLAAMWLLDGLLFCLVADTARAASVLRLYITCLLAGLALNGMYGIYQRVHGLPYLRSLLAVDPALQALTAAQDADTAHAFQARIGSDRIFNAFAYANVVAGYALLLLPLLGWSRFRGSTEKRRGLPWRAILVLLGCILLVYTRSKAGLLTAKLAEPVALYLLLPCAVRGWRTFLGLAGRVVWMTLAAALLAGVAYRLSGGGARGLHVADTVFALGWAAELLWLGRGVRAGHPPRLGWTRKGVLDACGLLLVGATLAGVALLLRTDPGRLPQQAVRLRGDVELTLRVRREYWRAGVAMVRDHPWRGVGLDQFQTRYAQYKTPQGWETRRAHNLYVQLAADGGLPLLAAFLLMAVLLLCPFRRRHRVTPDPAHDPSACTPAAVAAASPMPPAEPGTLALAPEVDAICRRLAPWVGVAALGVTYLLFLSGMAGGLSLEFFLKELLGGAGSIRGTEGAWTPLLVHGTVHLVLLPLVLWKMARWIWSATEGLAPQGLAPWITLALAAVLVHSLFDFHYHTDAIHTLWWVLAGILVACTAQGAWTWRIPPAWCRPLAVVVLAGGTVWTLLVPLQRMHGLDAVRAADEAVKRFEATPLSPRREVMQDEASSLLDEAARYRPDDPRLWRARIAFKREILDQAIRYNLPKDLEFVAFHYRRGVLLASPPPDLAEMRASLLSLLERNVEQFPWSASARTDLAHALLDLHPGMIFLPQVIDLYGEAIRLYPTQARYHADRARLLEAAGRLDEARTHAHRALALDAMGTDHRSALWEHLREAMEELLGSDVDP